MQQENHSTLTSHIWKSGGPIVLSAFSLFVSFHLLQPLAFSLDPSFDFLARRGVGKWAFISMVIYHIFLFMSIQPRPFLKKFLTTNVSFMLTAHWIKPFLQYFILFMSLHWLMLLGCQTGRFVAFNRMWGTFSVPLCASILFGFMVVFLLAWTEELIFRGTLFLYFNRFFPAVTSAVITSLFFALAHNITSPTTLLWTEWRLGIGLFLLGLMLNLFFIKTGTLYSGIGVHAGLVFVKVILRKAPLFVFTSDHTNGWLLAADLRQAHSVHLFFIVVSIVLFRSLTKKQHARCLH